MAAESWSDVFFLGLPVLERIEQWVEDRADALIESGQIKTDRLNHELITLDELKIAAHPQGFTPRQHGVPQPFYPVFTAG